MLTLLVSRCMRAFGLRHAALETEASHPAPERARGILPNCFLSRGFSEHDGECCVTDAELIAYGSACRSCRSYRIGRDRIMLPGQRDGFKARGSECMEVLLGCVPHQGVDHLAGRAGAGDKSTYAKRATQRLGARRSRTGEGMWAEGMGAEARRENRGSAYGRSLSERALRGQFQFHGRVSGARREFIRANCTCRTDARPNYSRTTARGSLSVLSPTNLICRTCVWADYIFQELEVGNELRPYPDTLAHLGGCQSLAPSAAFGFRKIGESGHASTIRGFSFK